LKSFDDLEEQDIRLHAQRLINATSAEAEALSATTADYAHWDDTMSTFR
jgi:sensor domain CHASE-containing protein